MNFRQVYDGEWLPIHGTTLNACCDCGLVHEYQSRVRKGKIELRAWRAPIETRRLRKAKRFPISRKKR